MSMLRLAMILGAGALGAAFGYAQGKMDAIKDKVDYHRLEKDNPEYTLKNDVSNFVKKTAEVMSNAKDQIINSKEFEQFGKSFTRDELMHLLCNSQVFDTVTDILKQNNGEFRPGYYFKKDEWDKYYKKLDESTADKVEDIKQRQTPMTPPQVHFTPPGYYPPAHKCDCAANMPYQKPEMYGSCPPPPQSPYRCSSGPLPVSKKSWEEYQESGEMPPLNTVIPRFRSSEEQPKKPSDAPHVEETEGSKITIKKK